jgi:thiosulfate reductase cytochrome b subunit
MKADISTLHKPDILILRRHRTLSLLSAASSYVKFCALAMAESAYLSGVAIQNSKVLDSPRHSVLVRVTHWIQTLGFIALVLSGIAILLAHPRLYWGETGAVGTPSLIDLPLPFVLDVPIRGPGRYLHFLSAWVFVLTGLLYVLSGLFTRHFRKNLVPSKTDFGWKPILRVVSNHVRLKRPSEEESRTYNVLQRLTYLAVVFLLSPLIVITGLAMSPAVTSVFPVIVNVFGGQQSARTIHFFVSVALVLFLLVHIAMVCLAGFKNRMRAMITGRNVAGKELS